MNLERIRRQGLREKKYIFYRERGKEVLVVNKYGKNWWKKATTNDIKRVTVK